MSGSADAFRIDGDDLILRLKVTPGARIEGFDGLVDGPAGARLIRLKVRAKAQDNAANEAVIAALAAHLRCPRSAVALESGRTARVKALRVIGGAALAGRLKELIGK